MCIHCFVQIGVDSSTTISLIGLPVASGHSGSPHLINNRAPVGEGDRCPLRRFPRHRRQCCLLRVEWDNNLSWELSLTSPRRLPPGTQVVARARTARVDDPGRAARILSIYATFVCETRWHLNRGWIQPKSPCLILESRNESCSDEVKIKTENKEYIWDIIIDKEMLIIWSKLRCFLHNQFGWP